jgi:DNA-binding FadR family transcriptional regulator
VNAIQEVFRLRLLLEPEAAELAAQHATKQVVRLRELAAQHRTPLAQHDPVDAIAQRDVRARQVRVGMLFAVRRRASPRFRTSQGAVINSMVARSTAGAWAADR